MVGRAHSRLGEGGYHRVFKNCEHFAHWCKTGEETSSQVERAATAAGGVVGTTSVASVGVAAVAGAGAVAGLSASGVMSGLAGIGGTAATGIGVVAAAPAIVANVATRRALRDDPFLPEDERTARRVGRTASTAGVVAGTGASLALVSAAGIPGLSAAGISSGLAAIGGSMVGGLLVAAAIPAGLAVLAGFVAYRASRR